MWGGGGRGGRGGGGRKKQPCRFFNTPTGCRKGASCDFEHGAPNMGSMHAMDQNPGGMYSQGAMTGQQNMMMVSHGNSAMNAGSRMVPQQPGGMMALDNVGSNGGRSGRGKPKHQEMPGMGAMATPGVFAQPQLFTQQQQQPFAQPQQLLAQGVQQRTKTQPFAQQLYATQNASWPATFTQGQPPAGQFTAARQVGFPVAGQNTQLQQRFPTQAGLAAQGQFPRATMAGSQFPMAQGGQTFPATPLQQQQQQQQQRFILSNQTASARKATQPATKPLSRAAPTHAAAMNIEALNLKQEEFHAFLAPAFTLTTLPDKPPPSELCT